MSDHKIPMLWVHGILLVLMARHVTSQTAPSQCSYVTGNEFYCDYTTMPSVNRPINFGGFSPTPQSINVKVNGFVPYKTDTRMFSTSFSTIDKNTFDNNFPSSAGLICERKGQAYFEADTFANMSHVQRMKISDCTISYISAYAFEELEYLDYLGFERGSLTLMSAYGLLGVSVEKLTADTHTIPENLGMFEVLYTALPFNSVPAGFLANFKNLTAITMKGCSIQTIPSYTFTYNTKIRFMDLSDNLFSSLYGTIFRGMDALSELRLYDIEWECTCANLWFVSYTRTNNVTVFGDMMCYDASNASTGQNVYKYYYSNCVTEEICAEGETGFVMLDQCMNIPTFVTKILGLIAFCMNIATLVLVIITLKQAKTGKGFVMLDQCMNIPTFVTKILAFIAFCMNIATLVLVIITLKQAKIRKATSNPRSKWNNVKNKLMKNRKGRVGPNKK